MGLRVGNPNWSKDGAGCYWRDPLPRLYSFEGGREGQRRYGKATTSYVCSETFSDRYRHTPSDQRSESVHFERLTVPVILAPYATVGSPLAAPDIL